MIIFLYGEDTFRSRKKLNDLKDKFLREVDPSGNSLNALDGAVSSMEKINEAISPSSLLAKKRMIIIENLFSNKGQTIFTQLLEYFKKKKNGDNIVIFWDSIAEVKKISKRKNNLFLFLKKQKYAQDFKPLSNTEATNWARKEVEARGDKISYQASAALAGLVGSDLWQINNEIDKLINFKASQRLHLSNSDKGMIIEAEDVNELVRGKFDEKIFALTDAISVKNKKQAARLLEEQIELGLTDGYLLNMIVRQFKILLQIRQAIDAGLNSRKIINLLKLHPFIVQKGTNQVRNFSLPALKNILNKLVEIDYKMKTGLADAKASLSLLIAGL